MKSYTLLFFLLSCLLFLGSCSKTPKNSQPKTVVIVIPGPLPNTVDKTDTIKVMAYNVLKYGNGCQAGTAVLNGYLQTIIQYAQPDILSCEKMAAFMPSSAGAANLADDITTNALNVVFPGRYAYATPTNMTNAGDMSVLFYNKQKLTFLKTETLEANITDFNLYKLYYNDPNLAVTHDTTFLYVIANHTQSGSSSTSRDIQETLEMKNLRAKFAYLPNLISMGDFNFHNSAEPGYQSIISSADTATKMSDPPFYPDKSVQYPAQWTNDAFLFEGYLTTTTRALATVPNSCGTSDGAKSWYDHIFISPWLINGSNYIQYIPDSYKTIGNDGHRMGVDINSPAPVVNTSAPSAVIDALFQFSDKYPVSIKLLVKANRNAYSIADPPERN
ncbi:MAG: hypothetical protein ACHQIM_10780 [Sphingobacteriales bacterium]